MHVPLLALMWFVYPHAFLLFKGIGKNNKGFDMQVKHYVCKCKVSRNKGFIF